MRSNPRRSNRTDDEIQATRQPDPLSELENLRYDLGHIEALLAAALEALAGLPRADSTDGRRSIRRLDHLVSSAAEVASATLDRSDRAMDGLGVRATGSPGSLT